MIIINSSVYNLDVSRAIHSFSRSTKWKLFYVMLKKKGRNLHFLSVFVTSPSPPILTRGPLRIILKSFRNKKILFIIKSEFMPRSGFNFFFQQACIEALDKSGTEIPRWAR